MECEFTDEQLAEAAKECLTQPPHSAWWDDKLYDTFGSVMSWAERGDDILSESNYKTAVRLLEAINSEDVMDISASHWLVGSLRQLFVRVRDDEDNYTPVFIEAVRIAYGLKDYPVLDEDDYSERESEAFEKTLDMAINDAARDFDDEDELTDRIKERVRECEDLRNQCCHPDDISWEMIKAMYIEERNKEMST
jgi:hypothetical protein